MVTDILALIGLVVVGKKGYELYRNYRAMQQENAFLRQANERREAGNPSPTPQGY